MKLLVMSAMLAYALAQDFQVQCPDIDVPLMAEILHHLRCTFFFQETCKLRIYRLIQYFFHQPYTHTHNSGLEKDAISIHTTLPGKICGLPFCFFGKNQTWPPKWWIPESLMVITSCPEHRRKICWLLWKLKIVSVRTWNSYWWAGGACHVIWFESVVIIRCLN